jgi:signal transduction histidine kinase
MASAAKGSQAQPTNLVDVSDEAIAALVAEGARVVAAGVLDGPDEATASGTAVHAHELLLGLTHDIRSPLSSILVLVERLRSGRSGPVTPLQERQLSLVYSAAFGLSAFADDVLELSRGATRLVGEAPVAFSISETLRTVLELVQPIAEEKGLALRCSAPRDERRVGYPDAMHRVILNLVTNALKFTDSGVVDVSASSDGASVVVFTISDSGNGLPAPLRDRFVNGAFDVSDDVTSAGLGLRLCAQLLGQMHSTLRYAERAPCGSTFSFAISLPHV